VAVNARDPACPTSRAIGIPHAPCVLLCTIQRFLNRGYSCDVGGHLVNGEFDEHALKGG
jgi:hypothetical protein